MPGPTPQLVALVLCDQAFQQAHTGNWCIIGAFDTIRAPTLPFTHPHFSVWVALSDFGGGATVELVVRDQEGDIVAAVRGEVPQVPFGLFQYVFPFADIEFRTEGVHTLELLVGGELITLRSFRVQTLESARQEEEQLAEQLAEQHQDSLAHEARSIWEKDPGARLCGLIAAPDASEADELRRMLPAPIPQGMAIVGLVPREMVEQLLRAKAPEAVAHLDPPEDAGEGRWLVTLIVTRSGFKIAHRRVEE